MKSTNSGFTLIEVMIAVAIIALLVTIAYPQYSDYVTKSRRADAKVALTGLAQEQETYKTDSIRTYASVIAQNTDFSAGTNSLGCKRICQIVGGEARSIENHYRLAITTLPGRPYTTGFAITAEAIGDQSAREAGMDVHRSCPAFALDSLNRKASGADAAGAKANLAAATPDSNDCWH